MELREQASWKRNAIKQVEGNHLASLEAAKTFALNIAQSANHALRQFTADLAAAKTPAAPREDDAAEKEAKPTAVARRLPRINVPSLLALALRASELLIEASDVSYKLSLQMIEQGFDPRPFMALGPQLFAKQMVEDIGIDFREIVKTPPQKVAEAFEIAQRWVDEARAEAQGRAAKPPPDFVQEQPAPATATKATAPEPTATTAGATATATAPEPAAPATTARPTLEETLRLMQHFTTRKIV